MPLGLLLDSNKNGDLKGDGQDAPGTPETFHPHSPIASMLRSPSKSSRLSKASSSANSPMMQSPTSDTGSVKSGDKSSVGSAEKSENGEAGKPRTVSKTKRKMATACITASMSTGRFLSKLGITRGDHTALRRLSRIGVGIGRSEDIVGVRYLKSSIGGVKVRIYLPETLYPLRNKPVVIYLHGGGWVISSTRCYHRFTALFARDTQTVVISVNYRLAPEHPFPSGLEDCLTVTRAVLNSDFDAKLFCPHSIDVTRVVLAGDSAGGNLACAAALDLVREGDYRIFQMLLVCPALQAVTLSFPSYKEHGPREPIGLDWFVPRYAGVKKPPDERFSLSRTVTIGSFSAETSPTIPMAPSLSTGAFLNQSNEGDEDEDDDDDDDEPSFVEAFLENGESSIGGELETFNGQLMVKSYYFDDTDVGEVSGDHMFELGQPEIGDQDGKSSLDDGSTVWASSPLTDLPDDEVSPFAHPAVIDLVKNKRAWPMLADDDELKFLPPTFIQACERDPLRSENELFAERMVRAGAISAEVTVLQKASHIESLMTEAIPTKSGLIGYQQLVDFVVGCHAKLPAGSSPFAEKHVFDQVTDFITD